MHKNRFISLFILVFVGIVPMSSQTILDFFVGVPDSAVLALPKKERSKIVRLSKNNKSAKDARAVIQKHDLYYTFEVADIPNAYLKLIGAMEGHLEMSFWNLQNGKKLIVAYHEACGPGCYTESINFYEYSAGKYTSVPFEKIFPDLFLKVLGVPGSDEFGEDFEADFKETMTFKIPQKGKNILVKWGSDEFIEANRNKMKGNRANLIWKDGKFATGDIFWEK